MCFEGKAQAFPFFLERVYALRAKGCGMRIGMGCKAQTTDIALAMARICNAADRPRPRLHTREEIVNTFLLLPRQPSIAPAIELAALAVGIQIALKTFQNAVGLQPQLGCPLRSSYRSHSTAAQQQHLAA